MGWTWRKWWNLAGGDSRLGLPEGADSSGAVCRVRMCLAPVENSRLPVFWKQRVTIWKGS